MNNGTKIRTILGILTTINTVLAVTDVAQFGNETVTFWYKLISVIINAIVVGINTYYNNDYTEEAAIGTGITRQLKAEKQAGYNGDFFYEDSAIDFIGDFDDNLVENKNIEPYDIEEEEGDL